MALKKLKTCPHGHTYYKSSDCPTCPQCEQENNPGDGFLSKLSAPARRALVNQGITELKHLRTWTQADILKLHGVGPATIPTLKKVLAEKGWALKEK